MIDPGKAKDFDFGMPPAGGTIYMSVADERGMMVSFIQSNYMGFGSGVVVPDTGISMQNRGFGFSMDPKSANVVEGGKRPFHTIIPAFLTQDVNGTQEAVMSFGVMGGDMQPQGHAQVLANLIDFGMNIQEAGEASRIRHAGANVQVDSQIAPDVRAALTERGHHLVNAPGGAFGGFQGILIDPKTGVLMGGSDPRKDGLAIGF
jgi:gamma-glutamyltranspeptidase/glutathione hydrolase